MAANHCQTDIPAVISVRRSCARIFFRLAALATKFIATASILARQNAVIPLLVIELLLLTLKIHCRSPYYMQKIVFLPIDFYFDIIINNFLFFFNGFSPIFSIFFYFSTKDLVS